MEKQTNEKKILTGSNMTEGILVGFKSTENNALFTAGTISTSSPYESRGWKFIMYNSKTYYRQDLEEMEIAKLEQVYQDVREMGCKGHMGLTGETLIVENAIRIMLLEKKYLK